MWLLYVLAHHIVVTSSSIASQQARLIRLNATSLRVYYDDTQLCLIENARGDGPPSYASLLTTCRRRKSTNVTLTTSSHEHGFAKLNQGQVPKYERGRSHCCTEDLALHLRQFDFIAEGFEGRNGVATDLMQALSQRNMSLVLAGDSMNNQLVNALLYELRRENILTRNTLEHLPFPLAYMEIAGSSKTIAAGVHRWRPRDTLNTTSGNHVDIYTINLWYGHQRSESEGALCTHFIPRLLHDYSQGGVLFSANIGLHLEVERRLGPSGFETMIQTMANFLGWMNYLATVFPSSVFAFRESTPAHFDSQDGTYEAWKSAKRGVDEQSSTTIAGYHCHVTNASSPENIAVARILSNWASESHVSTIQIYKYLAPFHSLKYGNCAAQGRTKTLDCVHYCAMAPPMWVPVWHQLIQLASRTSPPRPAQEQNINDAAAFSLPPYVSKAVVYERDRRLYVCYNGICRRSDSLAAIFAELGMTVKPGDVKVITEEAFAALLRGTPLGTAIHEPPLTPEGSVVKLSGSRELFLLQNSTRRAIASMGAFEALQVPAKAIVTVPIHALRKIPVGQPVPEP